MRELPFSFCNKICLCYNIRYEIIAKSRGVFLGEEDVCRKN